VFSKQTQIQVLFVVIVCNQNKINIDFVLVFAVFTQFLSFSGFVKVFCFGKMRKCIFLTKKIRRTSGNSISQKLREFDFFSYIHVFLCSDLISETPAKGRPGARSAIFLIQNPQTDTQINAILC